LIELWMYQCQSTKTYSSETMYARTSKCNPGCESYHLITKVPSIIIPIDLLQPISAGQGSVARIDFHKLHADLDQQERDILH